MTKRWEDIIFMLKIMNSESVNKERINMMLYFDETIDLQTLDNLQALGVLTIEQYQQHLQNLKKRQDTFDLPAQIDMRLQDSKENPDTFSAYKYSVCALNTGFYGSGIENQIHECENKKTQRRRTDIDSNV